MSIFARSLTVLAVCLLPATMALAADRMFGGTFCQPSLVAGNDIGYNNFGAFNNGTLTANVDCPFWLPFSAALTVRSVEITLYDRHPAENVECTVQIITLEGVVRASRTVRSAGFGQRHQFAIANFNNAQALGTLTMHCTIPPFDPLNGFSHVTTYRLRTSP